MYFYSSSDTNTFVTPTLEPHILVIAKLGKDAYNCFCYRPISLINVDVKIFYKIIASRLAPLLPKLDQVGFLKGCGARDNTNKKTFTY